MKIYEWVSNDPKGMTLTNDAYYDNETHPIDSDFDGTRKGSEWTPILIATLRKGIYKDFPHYRIGEPVISAKVKRVIEHFITHEVEFLPILHKEFDLEVVNVLNVLDCVDWNKSVVSRLSSGNFGGFKKLVFDPTKIPEDTYLFKIKELAIVRVFMTEKFKDLIEQNKLKGLEFTKIYDSEFTEQMEQEQQLKYEAMLATIEDSKGTEVSFDEARAQVDTGAAVASGKWKMQLDAKGRLWLGQLALDCKYHWLMPVYLPPPLLVQRWHEVEKSLDVIPEEWKT